MSDEKSRAAQVGSHTRQIRHGLTGGHCRLAAVLLPSSSANVVHPHLQGQQTAVSRPGPSPFDRQPLLPELAENAALEEAITSPSQHAGMALDLTGAVISQQSGVVVLADSVVLYDSVRHGAP